MSANDGFLHLPLVTDLIEEDNSMIYIREPYKDLFNIIWNNVNPVKPNPRLHRIAITGTPGIGKSMFLFYILWRLANMKTKRTVILRRQMDEGDIYVFQNEGCWMTMSRKDMRLLLKDKTTWYLTDALEPQPGKVEAVTILVTSPAQKYYSAFVEYSHAAPLYYLPFWSLEELQLVASFYSKSPETVKKRFDMIGGVIRYVLEKDTDLKRRIRHSFRRLISNQIVNEDKVIHSIIHYKVAANYLDFSLVFASTWMAEVTLKLLIFYQQEKLRRWFLSGESSPFLAPLLGKLFEEYAHQVLSTGGLFYGRSLDNEMMYQLFLPKMEIRRFYDFSECTDKNVYYKAERLNQPSIDSVVMDKGYFQITKAGYHPISRDPMEKVMKKMKLTEYCFVVPDWLYNNFKKQGCERKEIGQDNMGQESANEKEVTQKQTSMKRSSNLIGNFNPNKKKEITHTENEENLTMDFLRQYVISIPVEKDWNQQCRKLKAAYGITAEEEKNMWADPEYGMDVIFGD